MELQKKCLFSDSDGDREPMLMSFCRFQQDKIEKEGKKWDIALLLSGRDMFGVDSRGRRSYATMGLSTVTGICEPSYGCVIGEVLTSLTHSTSG